LRNVAINTNSIREEVEKRRNVVGEGLRKRPNFSRGNFRSGGRIFRMEVKKWKY
jgi:hypothetical protein